MVRASQTWAGVVLAAVTAAPMVLRRPRVRDVEHEGLRLIVAHRPERIRPATRAVTELGGIPVVSTAVLAAALMAKRRGAATSEIVPALATAGGGVLARRVLAEAVRRTRPPADWWWSEPTGYSYPSRHVTWIVLGCGAIGDVRRAGGGVGDWNGLSRLLIAVVGITRVVLAVHWPTDVVAGVGFGTAWRRLWSRRPDSPC